METVLELLARSPGIWAFALLLACGLGLPPWSEEVVILGSGYFVAQGDLGFVAACLWCFGGILAGDSLIWALGRFAGERVYSWPLLRRSFKPARRKRFNRFFLKYGTRAVFLARFLPGVRLWTYLVAGNLRMPWWKFATLDCIGALLTVPISVYLGMKFSENLHHVQELMHRFQVPLLVIGVLLVAFFVLRRGRRRRSRLLRLLARRRHHGFGKDAESDAPRGDEGSPE